MLATKRSRGGVGFTVVKNQTPYDRTAIVGARVLIVLYVHLILKVQ